MVRGRGIVFRHFYQTIATGAEKDFRDGTVVALERVWMLLGFTSLFCFQRFVICFTFSIIKAYSAAARFRCIAARKSLCTDEERRRSCSRQLGRSMCSVDAATTRIATAEIFLAASYCELHVL